MFNLEIQSTDQPGNQPVMGGKICCRIHLVNGPFIFNFIGIDICHGKGSMFNRMCQLKNNADQQTGNHCGNQKSDHPGTNTYHINRQVQ